MKIAIQDMKLDFSHVISVLVHKIFQHALKKDLIFRIIFKVDIELLHYLQSILHYNIEAVEQIRIQNN